jgi:hypothetical protein
MIGAICSLKSNKIIGYRFKKQIQIAHQLLPKHGKYLSYYKMAMKNYPNIGFDKENKLRQKIEKFERDGISQIKNNTILEKIFPELKVEL